MGVKISAPLGETRCFCLFVYAMCFDEAKHRRRVLLESSSSSSGHAGDNGYDGDYDASMAPFYQIRVRTVTVEAPNVLASSSDNSKEIFSGTSMEEEGSTLKAESIEKQAQVRLLRAEECRERGKLTMALPQIFPDNFEDNILGFLSRSSYVITKTMTGSALTSRGQCSGASSCL